jgi:hypothetical protein
MHFVAKVKNGQIKMPKIENAVYVEVEIKPIYIDPSIAADLPETFQLA